MGGGRWWAKLGSDWLSHPGFEDYYWLKCLPRLVGSGVQIVPAGTTQSNNRRQFIWAADIFDDICKVLQLYSIMLKLWFIALHCVRFGLGVFDYSTSLDEGAGTGASNWL